MATDTRRRPLAAPLVPDGHCRWCGEAIDAGLHPRARRWHPACVTESQSQMRPRLRRLVWARDRGICQGCGLRVGDIRQRLMGCSVWAALARREDVPRPAALRRLAGLECRLRRHPHHHAGVWHMDHLRPLWDGGEDSLANARVLCVPCHAAKTGREAAERALRRRIEESSAAEWVAWLSDDRVAAPGGEPGQRCLRPAMAGGAHCPAHIHQARRAAPHA